MKMKKALLSVIALCVGGILIFSCNKDDKEPEAKHCDAGFTWENDGCTCPVDKYLIYDGAQCVSLQENEWVTNIEEHYFWADLLLIKFPEVSNDSSVDYPIQANSNLRTDASFSNLPLLYYQYKLADNVDSFEFNFVPMGDNLGYSVSPEGYFWIAGKKTSDGSQILEASLQTRNESGHLTSEVPLHFFR